jgi:hypothetical protein
LGWKLIVAVVAALIALGLAVSKRPRLANPIPPPEQTSSLSTRRAVAPRLPAPRLSVSSPPVDPSAEGLSHTNLIARLLKGEELPKLSPEQVQSYLEKNHRSVESLLAAFHATDDPAYLREAMERYPADPRLDYVAWRRSQSPEERRQWLDAFKQSAPDNALANYLSARDYFKSGQNENLRRRGGHTVGSEQAQSRVTGFSRLGKSAGSARPRSNLRPPVDGYKKESTPMESIARFQVDGASGPDGTGGACCSEDGSTRT